MVRKNFYAGYGGPGLYIARLNTYITTLILAILLMYLLSVVKIVFEPSTTNGHLV